MTPHWCEISYERFEANIYMFDAALHSVPAFFDVYWKSLYISSNEISPSRKFCWCFWSDGDLCLRDLWQKIQIRSVFSFNEIHWMNNKMEWKIIKPLKAINCIVVGIPWSIGYSVSALIAQLTQDWFHMLVVIVCITAPWPLGSFSFSEPAQTNAPKMGQKWKFSKVYFFFVPESFRFCIAKGRIDDAKRCFKRFPLKKTNAETTNNSDCKNKNGNNYSDEIKETELLIENGNKPLSSLPNYLTDAEYGEHNPFAQVEQQNFLESVASMVSNQTLQDTSSNDQERFTPLSHCPLGFYFPDKNTGGS